MIKITLRTSELKQNTQEAQKTSLYFIFSLSLETTDVFVTRFYITSATVFFRSEQLFPVCVVILYRVHA